MCHDRSSFVSDERKTVDAQRSKEQEGKRAEAVDSLMRDAAKEGQKSPAGTVAKELDPVR
jgi:hypothetical protein